jgi:predicted ATPase
MLFSSLRVQNFRSIADSGELNLGPINLVVGRNNTGKSALLRAIYMLQEGSSPNRNNIRLGSRATELTFTFETLPPGNHGSFQDKSLRDIYKDGGILKLTYDRNGELKLALMPSKVAMQGQHVITQWPATEPFNIIYPSLAGRHQQTYQQQATLESANTVYPYDSNLVARVAALGTAQIPEAERFRDLCRNVLGFTLDVLLGHQQNQNQQLGIQVSRFESIPLESMGAGVSGVLGLLVSLCDAKQKLFLVEEPENDLHPQALKALLEAIIEASKENQFLITTHSSIVLTKLGAVPETAVIESRSDNVRLPTSTYVNVSSTEQRLDVLRRLGYELADFYLGAGWLIFEESSAERIIRDWLIPWFAPALRSLRTVAAKGTSRVTALTQALGEMLVFAHLEQVYKYRAWVIVDGDESGKQVVQELRAMFASWPEENFACWGETEFESYYPDRFQDRVTDIKGTTDKRQKQEMKKTLLQEVLDWIAEDPAVARTEFETSATDVVAHLTRIEKHVTAG